MHIEISQELGLPLVIHMRNAENETIDIIKTYYKKKEFSGVIHCFTGTTEFMQNLLPYNFFFSISGIVTFKNSTELRETIKKIPINKTSLAQEIIEAKWSFKLSKVSGNMLNSEKVNDAVNQIINSEKLILIDTDKKGRRRDSRF